MGGIHSKHEQCNVALKRNHVFLMLIYGLSINKEAAREFYKSPTDRCDWEWVDMVGEVSP